MLGCNNALSHFAERHAVIAGGGRGAVARKGVRFAAIDGDCAVAFAVRERGAVVGSKGHAALRRPAIRGAARIDSHIPIQCLKMTPLVFDPRHPLRGAGIRFGPYTPTTLRGCLRVSARTSGWSATPLPPRVHTRRSNRWPRDHRAQRIDARWGEIVGKQTHQMPALDGRFGGQYRVIEAQRLILHHRLHLDSLEAGEVGVGGDHLLGSTLSGFPYTTSVDATVNHRLVTGYWLLVTGYWLLATGYPLAE